MVRTTQHSLMPSCMDCRLKFKDHLIALDIPDSLNESISLANKIDRRLQDKEEESGWWTRGAQSPKHQVRPVHPVSTDFSIPSCEDSPGEHMQLGRTKLSAEERSSRFREGLCLYCSYSGLQLSACPLKGQAYWWAEPDAVTTPLAPP